jgi:hypothetical protein
MQRVPARVRAVAGAAGEASDSGGKTASKRCNARFAFWRAPTGRAGARAGGRLARTAAGTECARRQAKGRPREAVRGSDAASREGCLGLRCEARERAAWSVAMWARARGGAGWCCWAASYKLSGADETRALASRSRRAGNAHAASTLQRARDWGKRAASASEGCGGGQ